MKANFAFISSVIGGFTMMAAFGIEPPADDAAPPGVMLKNPNQANENQVEAGPDQVQNLAVPFLGISTAPLPAMVAEHIGIEEGSAIIVRSLVPDSPAAKAGISVNDVIIQVAGEKVGQPAQLSAEIAGRKVGERIDIDLIHRGKPAKVAVTLGERPADLAANAMAPQPMLEGLPQEHADRIRGMIEQNLGGIDLRGNFGNLDRQLQQMRERMDRAFDGMDMNDPLKDGIDFQANSTVTMMDDKGSVQISSANGSTEITVRDLEGNIDWTGPWDTDQDKASAPDDIRDRIAGVYSGKGNGFQFRLGGR